MRIGLFTDSQLKKVKAAHSTAPYHIIADSTYIGLANANDIVEVFLEGGKISILFRGNKLSKFKKISFYTINKEESIEFTGVIPSIKSRQYEGDFEFSLANNAMRLVNMVELDTYLDALQFFPNDADYLEVAKGRAMLTKKDIFRNLMWYIMPDSNKQYPLSIEMVKKIKAQNKEGIRPETIEPAEVITKNPKEVEPEYADLVGQISLSSLERTTRKRRDKERSRQQGQGPQGGQQGRRPQGGQGPQGGQQGRRPQGPQRPPSDQNRPPRNN